MIILIVEDDAKISRFLERGLSLEGHEVHVAFTGARAIELAQARRFDLVVLDLTLPDIDGLEVLSRLKTLNKELFVVIISARAEVDDRVLGLTEGADDYLTKPFSFAELKARLLALTRRHRAVPKPTLDCGQLHLDRHRHTISLAGAELDLTPREFELLQHFMENPGEVQTRALLADRVWGYNFDTGTNLVDVYVNYVRKKLGPYKSQLRTVRGIGYILDLPAEGVPAP